MECPQKCTLWTGLEEADTEWAYGVIRVCVCVCVCAGESVYVSPAGDTRERESKRQRTQSSGAQASCARRELTTRLRGWRSQERALGSSLLGPPFHRPGRAYVGVEKMAEQQAPQRTIPHKPLREYFPGALPPSCRSSPGPGAGGWADRDRPTVSSTPSEDRLSWPHAFP